jgi:DNA-binding protein HU-beta
MNKNDLIDSIASGSGLSKADSGRALEAFIGAVTSSLRGGGTVKITGFGTFSVSHRAATTGRNPRTGEPIQIPASKNAKFKSGKGLKDAVNW